MFPINNFKEILIIVNFPNAINNIIQKFLIFNKIHKICKVKETYY